MRHDTRPQGDTEGPVLRLLQALVLAALIKRPSYGYEIHARLNRMCAAFLEVKPTVVYGTLDRLAQLHLIEHADRHASSTRAVRVTYKATREGVDAYRRWIASAPEPLDHVGFMAKLAVVGPLGSDGIRAILRNHEQASSRALDELDELYRHAGNSHQQVESFTARLVLSACRASLEANRTWIRAAWDQTDEFRRSRTE